MKELTIKTEKVLGAYQVLNTAKYTKLDDGDKIKVWKIARALKPIATKFDEDSKDAAEKMKPEGFDEKLHDAQEYERVTKDASADASNLKMGAAEYGAFIDTLKGYNKLVTDAVKDFADKEVSVSFEPLSEDAFGKLMASNEWTVEQAMMIGDIITD
jgi:hypothetical protein